MFEIRAVDPEGIIARLVVFHEGLTDVVSRFDDCASSVRGRINIELNFSPNVEGLVLGCIDADFTK